MFFKFRSGITWGLICLALSGCGALMGRTITTESESVALRKPGQTEAWDKSYSAIGTGTFDDQSLAANVEIRLARTDLCRRYTETEVVIRSAESAALGRPGVALDAGVLAAGILGSLFLSSTPAKGGVILGASIPLIVDGVTLLSDRPETSRSEIRKVAEPTPDTDAKGIYPCGVMAESWAEIRFDRQVTRTVDGVYRFRVDEMQLMAMGNTDSITMPLFIIPKHVAQASRGTVGHTLVVKLGPAFVSYAKARNDTRRYSTLLRMAEFISSYPASQLNEGLKSSFLLTLPAASNIEELQNIARLPDLDPELRKAAHERFSKLRIEKLKSEIVERILAALRAYRGESTFSRNGFQEQALASQKERERNVATMCLLRNELAERDSVGIGERNRAWLDEFGRTLPPAELTLATQWLQGCTTLHRALP